MASSKGTYDRIVKSPKCDELLKAMGYRRSREEELQIRVAEKEVNALIEALDAQNQNRLEYVCKSYRFDRFIECDSSRILVANGNDIQQDADHGLLSTLSKRMYVAFQKVSNCVTLCWTCGAKETHPKRMVVNLLGQLLDKSKVALPIPDDGWQSLKFKELVKILKDCLEVQLARTRVLCIIDSIQHYESGEAPDAMEQVLESIAGIAEGFKDLKRVELKLFVTSLSECRYLTESSDITRTFNMTSVPEQFGIWKIPEEVRASRYGPSRHEDERHKSSHRGEDHGARFQGRRHRDSGAEDNYEGQRETISSQMWQKRGR